MKFLPLTMVILAAGTSTTADATVRCRTPEGRIYIGAAPPVGCRIEATYGTGAAAPAALESGSGALERAAEIAPPAPVEAPEPATGVVEAPGDVRPRAERRRARLPDAPRADRHPPADERSEGALLSRRAEMENEIDQALLEIARLRREIDAVDPPPAPRSGAPAEEIRARLRREAEYQRAIEPLRSRTAALRARINGIRAEFAELTSRIATAHEGRLPEWWPPAIRCNRCR